MNGSVAKFAAVRCDPREQGGLICVGLQGTSLRERDRALGGAVVLRVWDQLSRSRTDAGERGVSVDHSTIYRWVQRYAPEKEKRLRWQWRCPRSQLIRPVRGFKTLKTAYATIKGFEVMRALRKGQAAMFNLTRDMRGAARIVERAFGLGPCVLAEAAQFINARLEPQAG